jgi:hypothetical protein
VDAAVLAEITRRKRDRVWAATDALGELDELKRRQIGERRLFPLTATAALRRDA